MEIRHDKLNAQKLKLLSIDEVADILGISSVTVRRLKDGRKIPFYKIGGSIKFQMTDIQEYILSHRVDPINEL